MVEKLSAEERTCLERLGRRDVGQRIPFPAEEKFIELGLAELVMGGLDLTGTGWRVVHALRA
jgi:hypothetical protein